MLNRQEMIAAWTGLAQAWKTVWFASSEQAHWQAFTPHCDHLLALARQQGAADLEAALQPLLEYLSTMGTPDDAAKIAVDRMLPPVFVVVRDLCSDSQRRQSDAAPQDEPLPLVTVFARECATFSAALQQIEHYGYRVQIHDDWRLGLQLATRQRAVAAIVDIDGDLNAESERLIDGLNAYGIKWFALADEGSFSQRLAAVRHEAQGFLLEPLTLNALVDAVDPLAFKAKDEPYRVLVLDDSPTVLAVIQKTLDQFQNIHTQTLRDPARILDALQDFSPDVLLLDFHMNGCNGLEVAKIIRQNKAFESIPIVYLTAETSQAVQLEAMRQGGDDFLTKPISQTQLANAVVSRAERYRGLRKLMVADSLTGLYNHSRTKALLQQALLLAEREKLPVSYAIIDIDHFKQVNDTHGHAIGDKVIKALARLLRQRVRRADVVGRYGGEEFVVVLYNSGPQAAQERIERIREAFGRMVHTAENADFSVTFSAGIAHYPAYENMTELMVAADEALYASKHAGRNRVTLATKHS